MSIGIGLKSKLICFPTPIKGEWRIDVSPLLTNAIDVWMFENFGPSGIKRSYRWRTNWGDRWSMKPIFRRYWFRHKEDYILFQLKWA